MTLEELRLDTRFLTNASSDDYPNVDLDRNLNNRYDSVVTNIWKNQDGWKFDDSSYSTLPEAFKTLIAGLADYPLPTSARKLERVEVRNKEGKYVPVARVQEENEKGGIGQTYSEDGFPRTFTLKGRSVVLSPAPSADEVMLDAGIKVFVSRSVQKLIEAADEPGFDREFHRLLSIGAAIDWCVSADIPRKRDSLQQEELKIMANMIEFYANRDKTIAYRISVQREDYRS